MHLPGGLTQPVALLESHTTRPILGDGIMNCVRHYDVIQAEFFKRGETKVTATALEGNMRLTFVTTNPAAPKVGQKITANLSWKDD